MGHNPGLFALTCHSYCKFAIRSAPHDKAATDCCTLREAGAGDNRLRLPCRHLLAAATPIGEGCVCTITVHRWQRVRAPAGSRCGLHLSLMSEHFGDHRVLPADIRCESPYNITRPPCVHSTTSGKVSLVNIDAGACL
jgi:hypothetical protein